MNGVNFIPTDDGWKPHNGKVFGKTVPTTTYGDKLVGPKPQITQIGLDQFGSELRCRIATEHQVHELRIELVPQTRTDTLETSVHVTVYEDGGKFGKFLRRYDLRTLIHKILEAEGEIH